VTNESGFGSVTKKYLFAYYGHLLKVLDIIIQRKKVVKKSQKVEIKVFLTIFA
jgi:hypothetical protein